MEPAELEALTHRLTEHMVAKGVRRLNISDGGAGWRIELELDPAAQTINAPALEQQPEDQQAKAQAGLCSARGCHEKSGHMRTGYCRQHFSIAVSGRLA